ncbi:hypothetical protein B0H10DRAFT_2193268 [Mycena sp. CBHHK59/15]|nr:hypothetical protein B0H10DRAFT_2193268 [Mycena sp. CBHHK59/15]
MGDEAAASVEACTALVLDPELTPSRLAVPWDKSADLELPYLLETADHQKGSDNYALGVASLDGYRARSQLVRLGHIQVPGKPLVDRQPMRTTREAVASHRRLRARAVLDHAAERQKAERSAILGSMGSTEPAYVRYRGPEQSKKWPVPPVSSKASLGVS